MAGKMVTWEQMRGKRGGDIGSKGGLMLGMWSGREEDVIEVGGGAPLNTGGGKTRMVGGDDRGVI